MNNVTIKHIKKARMWCKTTKLDNGKFKQEWSIEKPKLTNKDDTSN